MPSASSKLDYRINVFHDEKFTMIVQMSSCPLRGIVLYTEHAVGFNCDIYEMWESNICSPCAEDIQIFFFHFPRVNRPFIVVNRSVR